MKNSHEITGECGGLLVLERRTPGGRGRGFDTNLGHVVYLSNTLYSAKSTGNTQEVLTQSQYDLKIINWDVKPQHKQT